MGVLPTASRPMLDTVSTKQQQEQKIKAAAYTLVVAWECNKPQQKITIPQPQTVVFPHAIVYDFEAYMDKLKRYKPTADLTY